MKVKGKLHQDKNNHIMLLTKLRFFCKHLHRLHAKAKLVTALFSRKVLCVICGMVA